MSKGRSADSLKKEVYQSLVQKIGYDKPYDFFLQRNSDVAKAEKLHDLLQYEGIYEGNLTQFKEEFFGVKKKETPSETSSSGSASDYVGSAGIQADGSTLEKSLSGFNIVREGQEFSQGKKETTLAQIRQMKNDRPDQTIVQVNDDKGKPTLRYLDEHKEIIKKKANRVPDAATLEAKPVDEAVLDYYSNKKDYVDMVEERRARGFATTFSEGKFIAEGINEMQRDVRNAIDLKVKEIGKPVLDQYLNLNESLKKTDPNSPEYAQMMADYQKFQQAHPDLQEYEGLVNRFWALDAKNKEAQKNPNYKGYYDVQAKKEQAQINADLMDAKAKQGIGKYLDFNAAPAATKELFDLGTGIVRAAAGIERFITNKKYASLDFAVEAMEAVIDPALNSFTATPSNRTKLVGQQFAEVGDYKVLLEGDKVLGVVSKEGGYQLRDQEKAQAVVAEYEKTKPKIKTQAVNLATATDVIVGGAMQLATGLGAASVGAKLGKVGSIASSVGSKSATIAANSASTYNKLYNAAIQELGPSNQKAAERYAALSSLAMSTLGTLINPLEQQLLNVGGRQAIKTLAKELSEGVAEQTAVRNAVRSLMTFGKTAFKEGAVEGAVEAVVDDSIKYGVNKAMLGEDKMEINLSQDILDNVAEETIGGLFGSVAASLNPSTFQVESLENAYKSPNRAKVLSKLDKDAKKHYEKVFAQADLNPGKSLLKIHQEELIKAKTGEEFVAPPAKEETTQTPTPEPYQPTTTALTPGDTSMNLRAATVADSLDPQQGDKITTPMGQSGTIVGFDIDEEDETPRYYKVKMDESGEETLISIADYNKNIYERGIQDLQSQGMSRNEAEFAVEAARSVKDISYQPSQVQADATTTQDNLLPDVGNMVDQVPDAVIEETPGAGPDDGIVEDAPEPVDQAQTDQLISEPEPTPEAPVEPTFEPVVETPVESPKGKTKGRVWTEPEMQSEGYALNRTLPSLGAQPGMPTLKQQQDLEAEGVDLSKVVFFTMDDGSVGVGIKNAPSNQSTPLEEKATPEDIQLATKLLGQARDTLRGALQETGAKVTKSLKKYGDVKIVFHNTNKDIADTREQLTGVRKDVTGFYHGATNSIHVSLESPNPTHTLLHEALHVFMRSLDVDSFNKLFDELVSTPEYTQVLKTKGRSPKEHAALYPERWQKEEALVEYFAAIASGEIEVKKDSKVIEILNRLLKLLGLKGAIDNTNIRIVAQGLARALREGIELERGPNVSDEVADEVLVDFPYYDKVTKLVENGINKGLTKDQIVQTILSAYNSQNISVPQSLVESIYTSRTAIRKKGRKPVGKLRTAFRNFHQKYFVANGGGEIREMVERLEGTIQRHVDQANELIKLAEKQSKGIDQGLVDRYLRDENSLAEKQEIVDTILRPNNVSEELIEKYLRGGTTRYQRLEAVKKLDPNVDWSPFVESRMNDQDKALIPVNLAATLSTMRQSLDNLSSYLVDEGYVVGDRTEVILENLGQYMSDVYGIFKDKKFKPTVAAKVKARKYFMEQIRKDANKLAALSATGNDLEEEIFKEAERMVNDYITKSKQPKGQGQGAPVAKKSESIFKQKEGVPDELKELLGKYGPLQEYAYTMFNLVNYVEKSKFQRRMVNLGKGVFMWDRNDPARPADANYELKGFASDKLKGDTNPFKGMMSDQATFEVLAGLDKLFFEGGPLLEKFLKFQGFSNKFKTVYSYQTHFGNILGNFFFMAFNGMVDASTAASFKMARKATGRDLFGGYGLKNDEVDEVLTILKNEQVIGQDVSLMAIRETVGDLDKTKTPSPNPFLRGLQKTRDAAVDFDKGLTNVYQAEDSFFKVLAYLTERKRYSQALYGKSYDQLDSIQKEEVNRIATEIAKANWPNYGRMGKLSQATAKHNVLFGNFLSFTFEAIRTYGNTWAQATRELKSDNSGVKFIGGKRLAGLVIGSLAADAALMTMAKTASGVFALFFAEDEEKKLNRDLRLGVPKFIQGGDLMFTDKGNGKYEVIDISAKNPLGIFRRHFNSAFFAPTDQEIAAAVSKQFLESFLSQSIAVKYTNAIRDNEDDNGNPIYLQTDTGTEAAEKIFAFTLKSIGPAAVNSALKVGKSDDPLVTLGIQISGHNVYKIDFSSTWGKLVRDYSDNIQKLKKELKKIANDEDTTDSEYQVALEKFNKKREKELKRLFKLKGSMLNVGLSKDTIKEELTSLIDEDESFLEKGQNFKKLKLKRKELLYD